MPRHHSVLLSLHGPEPVYSLLDLQVPGWNLPIFSTERDVPGCAVCLDYA
jgi:hypothetical protein